MAEVTWSRKALRQLQAIRAHIAQDNPHAARRIYLKVVAACDSLALLPNRERAISRGRRELTHVPPYLLRYRVNGGKVTIVEVRHSARSPE